MYCTSPPCGASRFAQPVQDSPQAIHAELAALDRPRKHYQGTTRHGRRMRIAERPSISRSSLAEDNPSSHSGPRYRRMPFPELHRDPSRCLARNLEPSHDRVLQLDVSHEVFTLHAFNAGPHQPGALPVARIAHAPSPEAYTGTECGWRGRLAIGSSRAGRGSLRAPSRSGPRAGSGARRG